MPRKTKTASKHKGTKLTVFKELGAEWFLGGSDAKPKERCLIRMGDLGLRVLIQRDYQTKPTTVYKVFGGFKDWPTFLNVYRDIIQSQQEPCLYEYKNSADPCRFYLDIDWRLEPGDDGDQVGRDVMRDLRLHVTEFWGTVYPDIPAPEICFAASIRPGKLGLHVHTPFSYKWHFANTSEMKVLRDKLVDFLKGKSFQVPDDDWDKVFDTHVYGTGAFRLVFSAKKKKESIGGTDSVVNAPPLKPFGDGASQDVKDYLVGYIIRWSKVLPSIIGETLETVEEPPRKKKRVHTAQSKATEADPQPHTEPENPHLEAKINAVTEAVRLLDPKKRADDFKPWIEVCFALNNIGRKWKTDFRCLFHEFSKTTTRHGYYDKDVADYHWNRVDPNAEKQLGVPSLLKWAKEDSGVTVTFPNKADAATPSTVWEIDRSDPMPPEMIGIPVGPGDKVKLCSQPQDFEMDLHKYKLPSLTNNYFIKCDYGVGKTTRLCKEIKKGIRGEANAFGITPGDNIMMTTFRTSLCDKHVQDLSNEGFKSYRDPTLKGVLNAQRMVVQLESLHKIHGDKRFEVVIIDESESLVKHMDSSTMDTRWESLVMLFSQIRFARVVIMADKDLGARSYNLLNRIHPAYNVQYINTFKKHQDEVMCIAPEFQDVVRYLMTDLNHNRNVAVCSNSKSTLEVLKAYIQRKRPDIHVELKSSETPLSEKQRDGQDIDLAWTRVHVLMFTPSILAGVSQDTPYFSRMYVIGSRFSCVPRELAQMMRRVRTIIRTELDETDILSDGCQYIYYFYDFWAPNKNKKITLESVRDMVNFRVNAAQVPSIMKANLAFMYNDDVRDGYTAAYKEATYYNTLETLDGFWNFDHRFRAMMLDSGMKLIDLEELQPDKELEKELQTLRELLKTDRNTRIGQAPILTKEEYEKLSKNQDRTKADRDSLKKTEISDRYGIRQWIEDYHPELNTSFIYNSGFVRQFGDQKVIAMFVLLGYFVASPSFDLDGLQKRLVAPPRALYDELMLSTAKQELRYAFTTDRESKWISPARIVLEILKLAGWFQLFSNQVVSRKTLEENLKRHLPEIRTRLAPFTTISDDDKQAISQILNFCRKTMNVPQVYSTGLYWLKPKLFRMPRKGIKPYVDLERGSSFKPALIPVG